MRSLARHGKASPTCLLPVARTAGCQWVLTGGRQRRSTQEQGPRCSVETRSRCLMVEAACAASSGPPKTGWEWLSLTSEDSTAAASVGAHLECAAQQTCRQPTGMARRPGPGGRDGARCAREELSASDQISDTRVVGPGCYNFTTHQGQGWCQTQSVPYYNASTVSCLSCTTQGLCNVTRHQAIDIVASS
jgi:hypothetical protein